MGADTHTVWVGLRVGLSGSIPSPPQVLCMYVCVCDCHEQIYEISGIHAGKKNGPARRKKRTGPSAKTDWTKQGVMPV